MALEVSSTLNQYAGTTLIWLFMLISALFIAAFLGGLTWFIMWWRRVNQFDIVILSTDAFGNQIMTHDSGGIYVDKRTKNKRLFLRKSKVGLDPNNIPVIFDGRKKKIYLLQIGLKNFRYLKMNISPYGLNVQVGEEDVNWAVNAYERQKKVGAFQSMLLQVLPYAALGVVSIIILIIFMYLFKDVGSWFGQMNQALNTMKEIAQLQAGTHPGTEVITGGIK